MISLLISWKRRKKKKNSNEKDAGFVPAEANSNFFLKTPLFPPSLPSPCWGTGGTWSERCSPCGLLVCKRFLFPHETVPYEVLFLNIPVQRELCEGYSVMAKQRSWDVCCWLLAEFCDFLNVPLTLWQSFWEQDSWTHEWCRADPLLQAALHERASGGHQVPCAWAMDVEQVGPQTWCCRNNRGRRVFQVAVMSGVISRMAIIPLFPFFWT